MNVKSLMEYYQSLNAATVQAQTASASNQTTANMESARLGVEAKRLDQEKQLEFFRQQMESGRAIRSQASAERLAAMDADARTGQGVLDKTFEGTQNEAQRKFNLQLKAMQEAGDTQRQQELLASNKDIASIKILEDQAAEQRKVDLMAPQAAATLEQTRTETSLLGKNKPATRADLIKELIDVRKMPGGMWESKETNAKKDRLLKSIEADLNAQGADFRNLPEYQDGRAPEVAATQKTLAKTMDKDFATITQDGRIQRATQLISDYQSTLASGRVNSPAARQAMDSYLSKRLNDLKITASDIAKIKQAYSLD